MTIKCSRCGATFGCACSMIRIGNNYYCKQCAIAIRTNSSTIPTQNTNKYSIFIKNNKHK